MRFLPIDNFVILDIPYLKEKIACIIAVMHSEPNTSEHLKKI